MWRRIVAVLAVVGFLSLAVMAAGGAYLVLKTYKPEKVDKGLQQELSALGVTLGQSTREQVIARFGPPEKERDETLSTVLDYPSQKLLCRIDKRTGTLEWIEYSSPQLATAKGLKVGATYSAIVDTYGVPTSVTPLSTGTRVRYQFGMAFVLEFSLNQSQHVTQIILFKA
jgi:hypothetical protein